MSASIGISIYPDNATDIDTLIQQADAAMYKAEPAGRSTLRFFSADMERLAEQRLVFSAALHPPSPMTSRSWSISRRPEPATAPSTASRRWRAGTILSRRTTGLEMHPLAEKGGLIEQIGIWSIREACRQMAAWRHGGVDIPCVAVNLSPINFQNAKLAAAVAEIHRRWPSAGHTDARDYRRRAPERTFRGDRDHEMRCASSASACRWTISGPAIRA